MYGRRRVLSLGAAAAIAAPHPLRAQNRADLDCIVIGAGAAGIAAARALTEWGYHIAVLEARDRIGGRAWTSDRGLGVSWDRGAQWLHNGRENPLWALARRAALPMVGSDFTRMQVSGGPAAQAALFAALDALDDRIDRVAARADATARLSMLATGDPWDDAALALSAMSIGGDPDQIALVDAAMMESGADVLVAGGPGGLLGVLAQGLPIHLGHAVRAVDMRATDHLVVSGEFGHLSARVVLVTIPPMVLAQDALTVTPRLPERHIAACTALGPADFVKVGLRLVAMPPDAPEFAVDPAALLAGEGALLHLDPRAPLATVIFAGAHGRALRAAGAAELADAAQAALRRLTGLRSTGTDHHDWRADPFSAGTWALRAPDAPTARQDYATPVDDRLFFAGEAAPGPFATSLGGAWQSGIAAAAAMDAAM